jgi:type IV pilus assembly protein PilE
MKRKNQRISCSRKIRALSLNEILVVLVIIGILVLLALPRLMPLISRAKATEAKLQLNHIYTLEKSFFYMNSKYSDDFDQLGFEQEKLITDDGNANYLIEVVEADPAGFRATATAVVDFDGDGIYNVWEIDQEKKLVEIAKD